MTAVEEHFGAEIDFGQIVKLYGDYGQHDRSRTLLAWADSRGHIKSAAGQSRSPTHEHVFREAAELDDADGDSPLYPADKCIFKEAG